MLEEMQVAILNEAGNPMAPVSVPVPRERPVPKDRLTIKEIVYHQQVGEQPIQVERAFERNLETQDSAYAGKPKRMLEDQWEAIDVGWLSKGVGTFYITNEEGKGLQRKPSPEEIAAIAARVIEVCFTDAEGNPTGTDAEGNPTGMVFVVPPGESFRATPRDISRLRIRSTSGPLKYSLWLFPR